MPLAGAKRKGRQYWLQRRVCVPDLLLTGLLSGFLSLKASAFTFLKQLLCSHDTRVSKGTFLYLYKLCLKIQNTKYKILTRSPLVKNLLCRDLNWSVNNSSNKTACGHSFWLRVRKTPGIFLCTYGFYFFFFFFLYLVATMFFEFHESHYWPLLKNKVHLGTYTHKKKLSVLSRFLHP